MDAFQSLVNNFSSRYDLSKRETDVLSQIALGHCRADEISRNLGISSNTVRIHVKNINSRVGVKSKTEILAKMISLVVN